MLSPPSYPGLSPVSAAAYAASLGGAAHSAPTEAALAIPEPEPLASSASPAAAAIPAAASDDATRASTSPVSKYASSGWALTDMRRADPFGASQSGGAQSLLGPVVVHPPQVPSSAGVIRAVAVGRVPSGSINSLGAAAAAVDAAADTALARSRARAREAKDKLLRDEMAPTLGRPASYALSPAAKSSQMWFGPYNPFVDQL